MTQSKHFADERAQLALAAYLEPLLRDQRVLLIDEPASPVSSHLAGVAEVVQVVAPEELAIAGSHADAELDLPLEADVFDVIWVAEVATLSDPRPRAVDAFRNALERDGVLVLCAQRDAEAPTRRRRSRGSPGEALSRLARGAFDEVRLLRQSAFDGFALESDADGGDETTLDQSLLRSDRPRPARYVALAGDLLPALEPSLVVRVPPAEAAGAAPDPELAERVSELDARLREVADEADLLRTEVVDLEEELERTREQLATTLDERDLATERLDKVKEQAREDRDALKQYKKRVASLERDVEQQRRAQADPDELDALRNEARSLEDKLVAAGAKIVELEAEVERRSRIARDLMVDLENLQSEAAAASKPAAAGDDGAQAEVDALAEREIALYAADELRAALEQARETSREQIRLLQAELDEARRAAAAAQAAGGTAALSPRELSGSALIARDSERVRAMGAELLTYRQQASERDQLASELDQTRGALAEEKSHARGLALRLDEAERSLEQRDDELPTADELAQLQDAVEKSSQRVRELSEKLADALRQVTRLEAELGEADRQVEEQTDLVSEVEQLGQKLDEEQERATDLQQALREADDQREQLRQQLQARERELEQARRERDEAREGLSEARNALQEVAAQRLHDSAEG